ncbi:hypothetical protein [Staphylococcus aureus]|uniref:hypothetical protein n=1 Tax=Staphylococcus aureus TaxID=1280 RepID=UPI004035BDCA
MDSNSRSRWETPGTKVDIPVKVTYPDGSTPIIPNDAQDNTPGYEDGRTNQVRYIPQTGDKDLPPGTNFEIQKIYQKDGQ